MSANVPDFSAGIRGDYRYFPAILAVIVLIAMLLFVDKLNDPVKTWAVPSLMFYSLGAGFVGWLHTMLYERRNRQFLPPLQFWAIVVLHVGSLAALIAYNHWRGAL